MDAGWKLFWYFYAPGGGGPIKVHRRHLRILLILTTGLFLTGCAFGYFGPQALEQAINPSVAQLLKKSVTGGDPRIDFIPQSLTPAQAIERYGVPDRSYKLGSRWIWVYRLEHGISPGIPVLPVYFSAVPWGGHTEASDLQFIFEQEKLLELRFYDLATGPNPLQPLYNRGSSWGYLPLFHYGSPGSVAE